MTRFYDVSLPIQEEMIVYPGNPKPVIERYSIIPDNGVNESLVSIGSHTGTHIDSKLHIKNGAGGTGDIPLSSFYGGCKVLDLTHIENEIHKERLRGVSNPRRAHSALKNKEFITRL